MGLDVHTHCQVKENNRWMSNKLLIFPVQGGHSKELNEQPPDGFRANKTPLFFCPSGQFSRFVHQLKGNERLPDIFLDDYGTRKEIRPGTYYILGSEIERAEELWDVFREEFEEQAQLIDHEPTDEPFLSNWNLFFDSFLRPLNSLYLMHQDARLIIGFL